MNIFYDIIKEQPFYRDLEKSVMQGVTPVNVTGVSNIHKAHTILGLSRLSQVLVICDEEVSARRICEDINQLAGEEICCFYPAKDYNFTHIEGVSMEYEHMRIEALSKIKSKECKIMSASVEACLQGAIPPSKLEEYTIEIGSDSIIDTKELSKKLIDCGYAKADVVEGQSQFSIRGDIIDIFPVGGKNPVRIETWGDEIDTVSYFDIESQRRTEPCEKLIIRPAKEILFGSDEELVKKITSLSTRVKGKKADLIKSFLQKDIDLINAGISLTNLDKYYTLAYEKTASVFDYFGSLTVISEYQNCFEKAKAFLAQLSEDFKILYEEGLMFKSLEGFFFEFSELILKAESSRLVLLDTFMRSNNDITIKNLINTNCYQTASWGGDIKHLIEELDTFIREKYCVVVFAGSEKTLPIIVNDLREAGLPAEIFTDNSKISPKMIYVREGSVSGGFDYSDTKLALLTQMKAVNTRKKSAKKRKKGEEIKNLSDISVGDFVVHSLYGIGKFAGITKLENGGVTKDYITIKYAGSDVLYVPVTQLDLVSRYLGSRDDSSVKLNKLNSTEWHKTRSRVKTAVKDMADELIKLYAQRQMAQGFAFSPDNDWQMDFEERFDYQETDDQLRAVEEIKADMEKPVPMDRLLCGDVGFGKTEVALRAAFKCVLDSKQCAILVPTTVLAWQHFQSAIKRFEHFPIKIELLSRFRTPKQQEQIIRQINNGTVDIVIGTHRLVQKDVKFKNLGLAIIDEEQRFGVKHKEKFKEIFNGVDMLTLSATPIPRTLNMAMSGIRDMSVIEEPPQDRHPIQTYVIEHNDGVIAQAIAKELRRGGQVYYIHNRIETIDMCVAKLQNMLPEARIASAHGQIPENELSEIWRQLIEHEIDILVCTTLIETGVDVSNVNTLIIEDADRLGLSQLYQLRGRVGRSNRRAFAYFTFRRGKVLSEVASKRLDAIREFTQFGSGFRIALRDLEIRGAGSVLSAKQHGHMEAVGYEMYLRLLNEAIAEQKGEALPKSSEDCLVDIQIDAYIPEKYIESLTQRIDCYRKIASIESEADSTDVIDELIDRYGDPPKSVIGLINVALMRNTASSLGITEITQRGENVLFFIKSPTVSQIQALMSKFKNRLLFNDGKKPYFAVRLDKKQKTSDLMKEVIDLMKASENE